MYGKIKIESALSKGGTKEIPIVICYAHIFIRDHWRKLTEKPWWYIFSPDIKHQLSWRRDVENVLEEDWFELPLNYCRKTCKEIVIKKEDKNFYLVNSKNGNRIILQKPKIGGDLIGNYYSNVPKTYDGFDEWFRNYDSLLNELFFELPKTETNKEGFNDLSNKILNTWGKKLYPIRYIASPLEKCIEIWGFEKTMMMLIEKPNLIKYAIRKIIDNILYYINISAKIGARGIFIQDSMAHMLSPEQYKKFNFSCLRKIIEKIHEYNMKAIHYYCGNPKGKWHLLLDTGSDALFLEDKKKDFFNEINEVIEKINGKITLIGNLDSINILERGSVEELKNEIKHQINKGRKNNNRFIMSLGSPITPNTPLKRVRLFCELAKKYGKYNKC